MTPADRQRHLIDRYQLIQDAHERLAAITARGARWPAPEARSDEALVPGCTSRVWLAGELRDGACHFRTEAESPLVRGLAALLCELYDGLSPADVIATEPEIVQALGLDRMLSPTRLHGLGRIRAAMRTFAEGCRP